MSYIGRSPQIGGYHKLDSITCDGSTAYTMQLDSANFTPESANHLIVSVNGVIQAPTDSFTVSGSTITFASSLSVSDTIDFIMALGNTLDIGTPSDSTVSLSKLTATGTKDSTTFLRGDNSFAVPSDNTPQFLVRLSGNQSVATSTNTRINFDVEDVDTDGAFDNATNYRFTVPSGEGGKYFIGYSMATDAVVDDGERLFGRIYLNGSGQLYTTANDWSPATNQDLFVNYSVIMDLSVGDYLELYMFHTEGGTINCNASYTRFWGFKLIG